MREHDPAGFADHPSPIAECLRLWRRALVEGYTEHARAHAETVLDLLQAGEPWPLTTGTRRATFMNWCDRMQLLHLKRKRKDDSNNTPNTP